MSRRESTIKAFAGALTPKGLDLTKYRQRSLDEQTRSIPTYQAAGALAFAAMDWREGEEGDLHEGNPLAGELLTLKYAGRQRRADFERAALLLVKRHGPTDPSDTLHAMAFAAVTEWTLDACPFCRKPRQGWVKPQPCPCAAPRKEEDRKPKAKLRMASVGGNELLVRGAGPDPRCPKCFGLGRTFKPAKEGRGMKCVPCGNSGRRALTARERWKLAMGHYRDEMVRRGAKRDEVRTMDFATFVRRWLRPYNRLLEVLRDTDKKIAQPVDIQVSRAENCDIVPVPSQIDDPGDVGTGAQKEEHIALPAQPGPAGPHEHVQGELPPEES